MSGCGRTLRLTAALLPFALVACGEVAPPEAETTSETASAEETPAAELSDQAYLVRLGLMRGHLLVGHQLHGLGALDAARTHAKHPSDELLAGMANEFAARGVAGFDAELAAHATAAAGDDAAAVDAAYAALDQAIGRSEAAVAASSAMVAGVIVDLLREAAAEYATLPVDFPECRLDPNLHVLAQFLGGTAEGGRLSEQNAVREDARFPLRGRRGGGGLCIRARVRGRGRRRRLRGRSRVGLRVGPGTSLEDDNCGQQQDGRQPQGWRPQGNGAVCLHAVRCLTRVRMFLPSSRR